MRAGIFISYASQDKELALTLYNRLVEKSFQSFMDRVIIKPGSAFRAVISREIANSTDLILILSEYSARSQWVFYELGQAAAYNCSIIPLLIDTEAGLPPMLTGLHYAESIDEVIDGLENKYRNLNEPSGIALSKTQDHEESIELIFKPNRSFVNFLDKFPKAKFYSQPVLDGAVEIYTFPTDVNRYGGIRAEQLTTIIRGHEVSETIRSAMTKEKLNILGEELRKWIGGRRAKPNRIRALAAVPRQMVLDNSEFIMEVANSDYFTMRTLTEISRGDREVEGTGRLDKLFDEWWGEPGSSFSTTAVPYHVSAQGVVIVDDPETRRSYVLLTLPSPHRNPIVPGWNASFAEQMWAPNPDSNISPWWEEFLAELAIDSPSSRDGDTDIWQTVKRGLREELGITSELYRDSIKLVASLIEQDMFFVGFVFVIRVKMTAREVFQRRFLKAPDNEIGPMALFPISGYWNDGSEIRPEDQFIELISSERFDGGPYLIPEPMDNLSEIWHISSRLRLYFAARHIAGVAFARRVS